MPGFKFLNSYHAMKYITSIRLLPQLIIHEKKFGNIFDGIFSFKEVLEGFVWLIKERPQTMMINHHLLLGLLPSSRKVDQYCSYIGMFWSLCELYKGLVCTNIKQITVFM